MLGLVTGFSFGVCYFGFAVGWFLICVVFCCALIAGFGFTVLVGVFVKGSYAGLLVDLVTALLFVILLIIWCDDTLLS